mmetsp:Transcript_5927/g.10814  ORF Transcript_5927/g.10814 Transcript_5927/m.10814 type:complete len:180 (+) Transcript_5927:195-734(+)|eukprot:CAMPEP_0201598772 /NCGR_PEP_ID=MMETSP0492-20130828/477_1 /ASSEMBLY_ACC=CAM_ASM_000837 /TAXON_ID=420259 /ORGANISM="Thalassiosira gravida, Strain GMp14c1" /LENGTH=179 /DNA_ID=CAMNT_0048061245 /DNA_START=195 /DNA_END=734 /DNA_ORIENTATION=+
MEKQLTIEPNKMKRSMLEPKKRSTHVAKRLRFSTYSQLHLADAKTREDSKAAWYTRKELNQFKRNAHRTAMSLRETRTAKAMKCIAQSAAIGLPPHDIPVIRVHGIDALRGIEHLISPEVVKYMLEKRRRTISGVLEEQRTQKQTASPRLHQLARVSEQNSSFSKEWCSRMQLLHDYDR